MTSEIRANNLKNRVGLGTVSFTNTGPVVSGIVTIANSTAEGVSLEDNAGVGNSLKITTPTGYVSVGAGNATFAHLQTDRGIFYFNRRISVDQGIISSYDEDLVLQSPMNTNRVTINKTTGLVSIVNDLDVDGHTNLDNVSIAGVTTAAGSIVQTSGHTQLRSFSNPTSGAGLELGYDSANRGVIQTYDRDNSLNRNLYIGGGNVGINQLNPAARLDVNGGFKVAGAIDANGDLDVDGHTNLDNVSVAGVSTFTGVSDHSSRLQMFAGNPIRLLNDANSAHCEIDCYGGAGFRITSYNQTMFTCENGSSTKFYTDNGTTRLEIGNDGNVSIAKDLDVDGHTNLDHVSIAGVTTFTNSYIDFKPGNGGNAHFRILCTGSGDAGIFFDAANGDISGSDYVFIGQKNNLDFVINPNANAGNIDFQRAGTTNVRIDSDGKLLVGTQNTINSSSSKFQVAATDATASAILSRFNASLYSSYLDFYKSRSNTLGTAYVVNDDDHLGAIRFYGADGSNSGYTTAAEIYGSCDGGSGGSGDMPGRITFHTRPDGAGQSIQERLRIDSSGKFKFPSVEAGAAHGESTADIEIGGRHIWKRITSTNHVTTSTSTNHFYLAFWRNQSGTKRSCYYKGVVVNVVAGGNYDWSGHGYVTHSSQTILSFASTTGGVSNTVYNQGHSQLQNNAANMQLHTVAYSYDGTYLYANFRFKSNESGTGWRPHYNVEVIDPSQCTYTCAPLP